MDAQKIVYRSAVQDDLGLLPAIEQEAGNRFADQGRADVANSPSLTPAALLKAFETGLIWVAQTQGTVCAFAMVRFFGEYAHLDEISVLPDYGRRGIGAGLLESVCAAATERGAKSMTLSTFRDIPWNRPWYARKGFTELDPKDYPEHLQAASIEEEARGLASVDRVCMIRELGTNI